MFVFGHPLRLIYLAKISEFSGDFRSLLRSALPSGLSFAHRRDSRVATRKNGRARQKYTHTPTHTHGKLMFFLLFLHLCFFALLVSDSRNITFFSDQQRLIAFTTNTLRGGRGGGAVGGVSSALRLFTSRQTQKNTNRSSRTGGARITVRVHDRRKTD